MESTLGCQTIEDVLQINTLLSSNYPLWGYELSQVVSAVVNDDLQGLVESRPLKAWKETLALICTVRDYLNLCSKFVCWALMY